MAFAIIKTDETWFGFFGTYTRLMIYKIRIISAVGSHNVWMAIAVQVSQSHVTCRPIRAAECTSFRESSFAIIQVDKLAIRRIVADNDVQVAVAIYVR